MTISALVKLDLKLLQKNKKGKISEYIHTYVLSQDEQC